VETLDRQRERVLEHLDAKPSDLERYIYSDLSEAQPRYRTASHLTPYRSLVSR
jgi:hypothetical protein